MMVTFCTFSTFMVFSQDGGYSPPPFFSEINKKNKLFFISNQAKCKFAPYICKEQFEFRGQL